MPLTAKGLEGIVANTTRLSDVIGDKGQLIYSGYDINELAGKVSYKEVVYLLWKGKLPNRQEIEDFTRKLRAERELPGAVVDFIKTAPQDRQSDGRDADRHLDARPLRRPDMDQEATREINERRARSITAKIGVIAAYFHRARQGKSLPPVRDDLTEAEHFLYLINGEPQPKEASRHARRRVCSPCRPRHERLDVQRPRHHLDPDRFLLGDHLRDRHPQRAPPWRRE